mgnify:CR=1 FL=1
MLGESQAPDYKRSMTLMDLLKAAYDGLHTHSALVALLLIALPIGGTALARIGKGGRTDADGKLIASLVIGLAVLLVFAELVALLIAAKVVHRDVFGVMMMADAVLILGPPLSLAACIAGLRLVFPLGQLATIRTLRDAGLMLGVGAALLWVLSRFKGWGVWFLGSIAELIVIAGVAIALGVYLVRRSTKEPR